MHFTPTRGQVLAEDAYHPTDLTTSLGDYTKRQEALQKGIPSILSISSARAGSSSIANQLSAFSGCPRVGVDAQPTPIEHDVAFGMLQDFVRGGVVSYVHSRASKKNIDALNDANLLKFILHVRDPRQSLLSNYFSMHAMGAGDWGYLRVYYNNIPLNYEQMSFEEHMDWHIENVYRYYWLEWIEEWYEVAMSWDNLFEIKIMTFESMKREPLRYFKEIGDFFDLDWSHFTDDDLLPVTNNPKTEVKGRTDYWRQKLTPRQIEKLQELTPDSLLKNFDWTR